MSIVDLIANAEINQNHNDNEELVETFGMPKQRHTLVSQEERTNDPTRLTETNNHNHEFSIPKESIE